MNKHTPGPWGLTHNGLGVCVEMNSFLHPTEPRKLTEEECEKEGIEPCDDYYIADCSDSLLARENEECIANAQLISAAPDLLEALKGLVYHSDKCQGHRNCTEPVELLFKAARQALVKAEGV